MKKDILFVVLVLFLGYLGIKYSGNGQDESILLNKQKQVQERRRALENLSNVKVLGVNESNALRSSAIDVIGRPPDISKLPHAHYEEQAFDERDRDLENKGAKIKTPRVSVIDDDERNWQFHFDQWKGYFASAISINTGVVDVNSASVCVMSIMWVGNEKQLVNLSSLTNSTIENRDLVLIAENEGVIRFKDLREFNGFALATKELLGYCQETEAVDNAGARVEPR